MFFYVLSFPNQFFVKSPVNKIEKRDILKCLTGINKSHNIIIELNDQINIFLQ